MARVELVGNLAQLTGGVATFDLPATSVKELFAQLTVLHPATLLEPIGPDSEVFVLPQIAGGD
jgi:hypothetical protein